jgi:hypothetical protein
MTAIARPRLNRSAHTALRRAPSAAVTDTTDTNAPSCVSDAPHSAFSCGNVATMTCRSAKLRTMSANAAPNTSRISRTETRFGSSVPSLRETVAMAPPGRCTARGKSTGTRRRQQRHSGHTASPPPRKSVLVGPERPPSRGPRAAATAPG